MTSTKKFGIKVVAFLLILVVSLIGINRLLVPKFYFTNNWPTTSVYTEFYKMDKNTIDVLFLGSSHGETLFYPQELYDEYGIRSYNLSCEQQNVITSYYWLKEALRFQNPKVVVLESTFCFPYWPWSNYYCYNSTPECTRKAIDAMRWSHIKVNAVRDFSTYESEFTMESFLFNNIVYHDRWKELVEEDFLRDFMENNGETKGFAPLTAISNNYDYKPIQDDNNAEAASMMYLMDEYFEKIISLCKDNNIEFVLVTAPSITQTAENHNGCELAANQFGFNYYDFNSEDLYNEIEYNFALDNSDDGHLGLTGAKKITLKIGEILTNEYNVEPIMDKQWEESRQYNERIINNLKLKCENDALEYVGLLDKDKYNIFVAIYNNGDSLNANGNNGVYGRVLEQLGVEINGSNNQYVIAAVEGSNEIKVANNEQLFINGLMQRGKNNFVLGIETLDDSSMNSYIKIDGIDYATNVGGINIVVFDPILCRVVSSVGIIKESEELVIVR